MRKYETNLGPSVDAQHLAAGFVCPHCSTQAEMTWWASSLLEFGKHRAVSNRLDAAQCRACGFWNIWVAEVYRSDHGYELLNGWLVYPHKPAEPLDVEPNEDLPDDIQADFREAASIAHLSARGAAALLRLCVDKLCRHILGEDADGSINANIGRLSAKGLSPETMFALDYVRLTGNDAVHEDIFVVDDDPDVVPVLFNLVNVIAENLISRPKAAAALFDSLPESKKEAIAKRNARAKARAEAKAQKGT